MDKYIKRLIKCGYSADDAKSICAQFIKDFSLFELNNFILFMESNYVDKV